MAGCTFASHSASQIGGVPVMRRNEASTMFTMWNRLKAMGNTPSRSKWLTWSRSMVATAS